MLMLKVFWERYCLQEIKFRKVKQYFFQPKPHSVSLKDLLMISLYWWFLTKSFYKRQRILNKNPNPTLLHQLTGFAQKLFKRIKECSTKKILYLSFYIFIFMIFYEWKKE